MFRLRNIDTGKYFGSRKWGEDDSKNGKFYETANKALAAAFKGGYANPNDYELVEYELVEKSASPANTLIKENTNFMTKHVRK